jgi:hypothetical protein
MRATPLLEGADDHRETSWISSGGPGWPRELFWYIIIIVTSNAAAVTAALLH